MPKKIFNLIESWDQAWLCLEEHFNFKASEWQRGKLQRFHELLLKANQLMNLTKHDSLADFLTFHLLDTAMLLPQIKHVAEPRKYLDLGSGCGVPGIIMHIFLSVSHPNLQTILCESRIKRANYLSQILLELELNDSVFVISERAENINNFPEYRKKFDLITARAFAKPLETLQVAYRVLKPSGIFLTQTSIALMEDAQYQSALRNMKGKMLDEEYYDLATKNRCVGAVIKL